jgi:hypothetical protein
VLERVCEPARKLGMSHRVPKIDAYAASGIAAYASALGRLFALYLFRCPGA